SPSFMSEQPIPSEPKFWLHVPLQTTHSEYLTPPANGRLTILGYPCRLCVPPPALHQVPYDMTGSSVAVRQYLLFDPLSDSEARKLLNELVSRMPVLAFKEQLSYEIPNHAWIEKHEEHGGHNLTYPALISSHLSPSPNGLNVFSKSTRQAVHVLESLLVT